MMRMPVNLHFVSLIFLVTFKTVSSDIQPISITVQEGNSVTLNTTEKAQFHDFLWIKNNLDNIVLYDSKIENIYPSYKNRVDFNKQTLSITIKNMQKTDSGLYTAKASGKIDNIIGLYNLTVVGTSSHGSTTESLSLTWITFLFLLCAVMHFFI
uniref:Immunoglobulin domain-containing protein n=1 Tax=Cyprinus carpio TaxID=7962 RepID=A0A8C1LQT6_CYPCA